MVMCRLGFALRYLDEGIRRLPFSQTYRGRKASLMEGSDENETNAFVATEERIHISQARDLATRDPFVLEISYPHSGDLVTLSARENGRICISQCRDLVTRNPPALSTRYPHNRGFGGCERLTAFFALSSKWGSDNLRDDGWSVTLHAIPRW
jgi:hypothetical protein